MPRLAIQTQKDDGAGLNPMKTLLVALFALVSPALAPASNPAAKPSESDAVFREPFTLTLHITHDRSYTEKFGKTPFVQNGKVTIFKGDDFGFDLDIQNGAVRSVSYQADVKKADVQVNFTQEIEPDGMAMMMLNILNNTKHTLMFDGLMTVPGKKGEIKTSILPVKPGLSSLESWPHPVIRVILQNIRIAK